MQIDFDLTENVLRWCFIRVATNDLTVRLGEYNFDRQNKKERDFPVSEIIMHERYNRRTQINDIAVLKLNAKVQFNNRIRPICLPPRNLNIDGQIASVTGKFEQCFFHAKSIFKNKKQLSIGWGTTSYIGSSSPVLQEALLPVWEQSECKNAFRTRITDKQLCAGYKNGGKDSCQVGRLFLPVLVFSWIQTHLPWIAEIFEYIEKLLSLKFGKILEPLIRNTVNVKMIFHS